ncbi:MAG: FHA domain-containing protein [Pseudobutyrivibrio sp.]|nr:FHA domain-containing protein [Pseudobutyrivibrio sp.]
MEFTFKRKHNESYMVAELVQDYDSYETRMIRENTINGILDINKMSLNGVTQYNYNISRKINLEDYMSSIDIDIEVMQKIILGMQLCLDEIARFLIDERHICIDKDTVFIEKTGDNIRINLCYYPMDNGSVQEQFRSLMEYFLTVVPASDRTLTQLVYQAYDKCLKNDYTLNEILELFQSIEVEKPDIYVEPVSLDDEEDDSYEERVLERSSDICTEDYLANYYEDDRKLSFMDHILSMTKRFGKNKKEENRKYELESEDFYVDPSFELDEKTVLLTDAKPTGKLIFDGRGGEDDFIINKEIFRIGSGQNNDMILHSNTVSNSHAKIVKENGHYYLMDLNSLNGTTVNGEALCYKQRYKLKPMDKIAFATERYIFM